MEEATGPGQGNIKSAERKGGKRWRGVRKNTENRLDWSFAPAAQKLLSAVREGREGGCSVVKPNALLPMSRYLPYDHRARTCDHHCLH